VLIHHMIAAAKSVTMMTPTLKVVMARKSSSVSYERSGPGGASCRCSTMAERLLQRGLSRGQERSRLELAREKEEPDAEEGDGRRDVERMHLHVLRECGGREPEDVEPSGDEHHGRDAREARFVALQVARQEQHERQYEVGENENDRARAPAADHAAHVP